MARCLQEIASVQVSLEWARVKYTAFEIIHIICGVVICRVTRARQKESPVHHKLLRAIRTRMGTIGWAWHKTPN